MATCKHCEGRILWCELPDGKRLPINPAPDPTGDLKLSPSHPDQPMRVEKVGAARDESRWKSHTDTCPNQEKKSNGYRGDPSDPGPTEPTW